MAIPSVEQGNQQVPTGRVCGNALRAPGVECVNGESDLTARDDGDTVQDWERPPRRLSRSSVSLNLTRLVGTFSGNRNLLTYLIGCSLFACGATFLISSHLGTDPLDTLCLGILRFVPLTIGITQTCVAALFLGIWSLWNRRKPIVSPLITFFFCGSIIDVLRHVEIARRSGLDSESLMFVGLCLCSLGSAYIIMSGFGVRAMDLLAITAHHRTPARFWMVKSGLEGIMLLIGWLLGGPVGIATLLFLVVVDLTIQPLIRLNSRAGVTDHGLQSTWLVGGVKAPS